MRKSISSFLMERGYQASSLTESSSSVPIVPLEDAPSLSERLSQKLLIKREDMVDSFGCGNKLRKLHYIIQQAKSQNIDTLISVGSLPSNQCKAVAKVAFENGLKAHVIYGGDKQKRPPEAQGSYLITSFFNPDISWYETTPWMTLEEKLRELYENKKSEGANPYIIKSGASDWPGILGSIELGLELAQQLFERGIAKAEIICAAGSAGTAVGLQMAAELLGLDHVVHGMCIGEPAASLLPKAQNLRNDSYKALDITPSSYCDLHLYDYGRGAGYDTPTPEELEIMRDVFRRGYIFDYNYMLKAYIGLEHLVQTEKLRNDSTLVLIHSGGQVGLFDKNSEFSNWHCKNYKTWVN